MLIMPRCDCWKIRNLGWNFKFLLNLIFKLSRWKCWDRFSINVWAPPTSTLKYSFLLIVNSWIQIWILGKKAVTNYTKKIQIHRKAVTIIMRSKGIIMGTVDLQMKYFSDTPVSPIYGKPQINSDLLVTIFPKHFYRKGQYCLQKSFDSFKFSMNNLCSMISLCFLFLSFNFEGSL
jgi:hypothetical protein